MPTELDRLRDLLTRTANALKGDPGPCGSWDWSDLPEAAQQVMTHASDCERHVTRIAAFLAMNGITWDDISKDVIELLSADLDSVADRDWHVQWDEMQAENERLRQRVRELEAT